jgi:hypothetical protein
MFELADAESSKGASGSTGENRRRTNRRRHHRRTPKSLPELARDCRSALILWVALLDMAKESGRAALTPTRSELSAQTSLSIKTISSALTALDKAGWIERQHKLVKKPNGEPATLLRIWLLRSRPSSPARRSTSSRSRRRGTTSAAGHPGEIVPDAAGMPPLTASTEAVSVEGEKGPNSKGLISTLDFPSERGEVPPSPPPSFHSGGDEGTPAEEQGLEEAEKEMQNLDEQDSVQDDLDHLFSSPLVAEPEASDQPSVPTPTAEQLAGIKDICSLIGTEPDLSAEDTPAATASSLEGGAV